MTETCEIYVPVLTGELSDSAQKNIIYQVTTMLATSNNVLFPGHNHLLSRGTDDPTLWLLLECSNNRKVTTSTNNFMTDHP